jgi:hypothetical protein
VPPDAGGVAWSKREAPEPLGLICSDDGEPLALDVNPAAFSQSHFATFPAKLVTPLVLAGCPKGGTVLDPFCGASTTLLVADRLGRDAIGIELNPAYVDLSVDRIDQDAGLFSNVILVPERTPDLPAIPRANGSADIRQPDLLERENESNGMEQCDAR